MDQRSISPQERKATMPVRYDWRPLPSDKQGLSIQNIGEAAKKAGQLTLCRGSVLYVRVGSRWVQFMVLYNQVVYRTVPTSSLPIQGINSTYIPPFPTFTCSSCGRLRRMVHCGTLVYTNLGSYSLCKDCEDVGVYTIKKSGVRYKLVS